MGRNSIFSPELAETICGRLAEGESLRTICADDAMPSQSAVFNWLSGGKHPAFVEQYTRAREAQAERMAEEILDIADDASADTYLDSEGNERTNHEVVARSRLRVDSRKWLASKLLPKKYGDRTAIEHTGRDGKDLIPADTSPRDLAKALLLAMAGDGKAE